MAKNVQSTSPSLLPNPLHNTVHKEFTTDAIPSWTVIMHSLIFPPDYSVTANNTKNQRSDGEVVAIYYLSD